MKDKQNLKEFRSIYLVLLVLAVLALVYKALTSGLLVALILSVPYLILTILILVFIIWGLIKFFKRISKN